MCGFVYFRLDYNSARIYSGMRYHPRLVLITSHCGVIAHCRLFADKKKLKIAI